MFIKHNFVSWEGATCSQVQDKDVPAIVDWSGQKKPAVGL